MGFRNGAIATVWKVKEVTDGDKFRDIQISTSRKNKKTEKYEADFSGYVRFVGNAIKGTENLTEKSRIVLKSVDVSRRYDKENNKEYVNFTVFEWEEAQSKLAKQESEEKPANEPNAIPEAEEFAGGNATYDSVNEDEPPFM